MEHAKPALPYEQQQAKFARRREIVRLAAAALPGLLQDSGEIGFWEIAESAVLLATAVQREIDTAEGKGF